MSVLMRTPFCWMNVRPEKTFRTFYVDIEDTKHLFADWHLVRLPIEWCEYDMERPEFYSKHWTLIAKVK